MGAEPRPGHVRPATTAQAVHPLERILSLEAAARAAPTPLELGHLIANDWATVLPYGQAFVLVRRGRRWRITAVTGQSSVEPNSPLVIALEGAVSRWLSSEAGAAPRLGRTEDLPGPALESYPYPSLCLVPLAARNGRVFAAVLLARREPFAERDVALAARLGEGHAHAWAALLGRAAGRGQGWTRVLTPVVLVALLAAAAIPVPLTAMAPLEVVPRDAAQVSAPLDGVIGTVDVAPNQPVRRGDVLLRFVDTAARGRFEVAEQSVAVAAAKEKRLTQAAFQDRTARRELAVATAELALAEAERDAARDQLERAVVRAERDGVAVFSSRKDLEGKPVSTGERLMTLADPSLTEFRIELPVKDSALARDGAAVRVYLDSDPLSPIEATVREAAFHATPQPGGGLAFVLRARPHDEGEAARIGYRGTAQVRGEPVTLGYLLLRRPITALRQHLWF